MTGSAVAHLTRDRATTSAPAVIVAGTPPGEAAGNAVSTSVLLAALTDVHTIGLLSHRLSLRPSLTERRGAGALSLELGAQPLLLHAEASLAGRLHRRRLRGFRFGWAINSRYAAALAAAGLPYAIWEATTIRDELRATDPSADRRAGRGTGIGNHLHRMLLPVDERLEGRLYRGAAALFAMSRHTRDQMCATHGLAPDRVPVLPHPPSSAFLEALRSRRSAARPERPIAEPARLLFVGRADDPRKNIGLLLGALRRLLDGGIKATLTIVGPYREAWARELAAHPASAAVTLAGKISTDALVEAYLGHDLFVLPSRQEGFGIVVAEALHAGLPVVSTRCGGPEAVLEDSGAGRFADATEAAMATAIGRLLAEPRELAAMARRARRHAETELSMERFAATVREATRACLDAAR